ncbi:MAG TPA: hypothetical protein V6D29_10115 [Leptolyngbyaceae cyanobacterium]
MIPSTAFAQSQDQSLVLLKQYAVGGAVAEIISASPDGATLAFTNAGDKQIGFIDIRDVQAPEALGTVDVSGLGEPTSVAITPNSQYAIAAILAEGDNPGLLIFIDPTTRELVGQLQLPGVGPDSVAITPDGSKVVVAIEDEEDTDNLPGKRPGSIAIATINYANPSQSTVTSVSLDLSTVEGVNYAADVQPEFVAISPDGQTAAVTLQENNAIALIDLATAQVTRLFSAGTVVHNQADLTDDDNAQFNQAFTGRREPDSIAFSPDGRYLITANEGDTSLESFGDDVWSGGRGWSIFDLDGNVVYESGASLEMLAAQQGMYPDDRSEKRGIEVEGATVATIGGNPLAFVASERGSFVAAYDISKVESPQLVGFMATGDSPEGVLAIPGSNLLLTANEGDGTISFFEVKP